MLSRCLSREVSIAPSCGVAVCEKAVIEKNRNNGIDWRLDTDESIVGIEREVQRAKPRDLMIVGNRKK